MKIFVTGATGFVGREVAGKLSEAGHSLRLLVRNRTTRRARELADRTGAELVEGDILEPETLSRAVGDAEAVVHLVGIISEVGDQTFQRVHVQGTENVVATAVRAGDQIKRLIHMSALGSRPNAVSRYHQTKWAAEQSVVRSGLDFTVFRPSIIYGKDDAFVNLFARMARFSPVLPLIGGGNNRLQPISVEAVAACFAQSVDAPRASKQIYNLVGPDPLTFRTILEEILKVTGRRRLMVPLPIAVARLQAAFLEWSYPLFLRKAPPLNRDQIRMLMEDNTADPEPARAAFKFESVPFAQGIARYLNI